MCTIPQKEKANGKQIFSRMCMLMYILFLLHNHQHSHDNNHQHLVAREGALPSAHWMAKCTSRKSLFSTLPQPFFSPSVIALSQFLFTVCLRRSNIVCEHNNSHQQGVWTAICDIFIKFQYITRNLAGSFINHFLIHLLQSQ